MRRAGQRDGACAHALHREAHARRSQAACTWPACRRCQSRRCTLQLCLLPSPHFVPPNLTFTLPPPPPPQERKELVAGGFKDKHSAAGAVLLCFGVGIAVEGCLNTWMRTGKLFPGPHLFAGAGIVVLWAAAASLVPQMQKGNETARSAHIALNALNLALFAWQVRATATHTHAARS